MNAYLQFLRTISVSSIAAALMACGGGGGGDEPPTPATNGGPATPPANADPTPATDGVGAAGTPPLSVDAPSYAASSAESSAYTALASVRQAAGAGLLAQSAELDVAAAAHAKYLTTNSGSVTDFHREDASKVDFYAATLKARVEKAGYTGSAVSEVVGGTGASPQGSGCVLGLLNTVYHAAALLNPFTQVGIGFGRDPAGVPMCVINLGIESGAADAQVAAAGSLTAYPYGGQTDVTETFYVAYEVPRPPVALFPNATAGTPVLVNIRNADYADYQAAGTLAAAVTSFTLKDAGGNLVPAAILSNAALAGGAGLTLHADAHLATGFAVLVPLSPLAKNVTYTAAFSATLKAGGAPLTKTWTFTTNP